MRARAHLLGISAHLAGERRCRRHSRGKTSPHACAPRCDARRASSSENQSLASALCARMFYRQRARTLKRAKSSARALCANMHASIWHRTRGATSSSRRRRARDALRHLLPASRRDARLMKNASCAHQARIKSRASTRRHEQATRIAHRQHIRYAQNAQNAHERAASRRRIARHRTSRIGIVSRSAHIIFAAYRSSRCVSIRRRAHLASYRARRGGRRTLVFCRAGAHHIKTSASSSSRASKRRTRHQHQAATSLHLARRDAAGAHRITRGRMGASACACCNIGAAPRGRNAARVARIVIAHLILAHRRISVRLKTRIA